MSSSSKSPEAVQPVEEEPSELVRFREEWLAELRRLKPAPVVSGASGVAPVGIPVLLDLSTEVGNPPTSTVETGFIPNAPGPSRPLPPTHPALSRGEFLPQSHTSTNLENALVFYRQAVEHEQRSDLDQALLLYRQAFRLVCVSALHKGSPIPA
jgi:F-box protein 9